MELGRTSLFLDPALAAVTKHKAEAIRLAKEQGAAVKEMCRRANTEMPPYEFEELIGKGAYGRVYKGRQMPSGKIVAIKVMDIDSADYNTVRDRRDESIKDFIHETKVMKQVKDAGAKNINEIIEAVSIHSQLWLVCEHCPGGSVRTLMRATGDKLDEKFIIPIARELAEGLRAIHAAGIIHRDIKAANILIHEEGRLEICDFGVAGIVQSQMDKRSTWVGTPHWMPPEMFSHGDDYQYGSEIDVWAYGCTLIECATGRPPNAGLQERMQIGRSLNRKTPKLESDKYSESLRDLVAFSLDSDPGTRPTMKDILSHSYIADSDEEYPTSSLSELVRIYYQWAQRGGQRISLFHHGGAAAAELPGTVDSSDEDWNFSTTDGFERRFSVIDLDQLAATLAELEGQVSPGAEQSEYESSEESDPEMTPEQRANFDERVRRGAEAMEGLFDEEKPSYTYETKTDFIPVEQKTTYSDLPLRTETDRSSVTSTFIDIDIGSFDSAHYAARTVAAPPFQLADADTIRANRPSLRLRRTSSEERGGQVADTDDDVSVRDFSALQYEEQKGPRPLTQEWKFPAFKQPVSTEAGPEPPLELEPEPGSERAVPAWYQDKRATMEWTFPQVDNPAQQGDVERQAKVLDMNRHDTLKAPLVQLEEPPTVRLRASRESSIGEPGDDAEEDYEDGMDEHEEEEEDMLSRPSTAASTLSTTASDTDYDPFRLDRPQTPPGTSSVHHGQFFDHEFPQMMDSAGYAAFDESSILDGPGPDEEDAHNPMWQSETIIHSEDLSPSSLSSQQQRTEQFPTIIPFRDSESNSNGGGQRHLSSSSTTTSSIVAHSLGGSAARRRLSGHEFPDLVPPSLASLTEKADEGVVTGELDRLLGDFISALGATSDVLSRMEFSPAIGGGGLVENQSSAAEKVEGGGS